ncbi:MFS general substrate transporter [Dichomitus squalens]|uniref:MFS general substrate transporter n=1 Tax=Dichomitus squalens TaxID=114155 RepID=A0A4Q9MUR0_9APHY|nr:MFS general substrate transporter [Dichomitus squalens]
MSEEVVPLGNIVSNLLYCQPSGQKADGHHPRANDSPDIRMRAVLPEPQTAAQPALTAMMDTGANPSQQADSEGGESPVSAIHGNIDTSTRLKANIMYGALLYSMLLSGWNDGTTGPLLPRIQAVYHIGFAVVSLIFVLNFLGFLLAASLNVYLTDRFGFGKVLVLGAISQVISYAIEAPAPPFPVFIIGYLIQGFGISLQLAASNSFVARYSDNVSTRLAVLHSFYGLGALSSPLVATQFSQLRYWSFHYLVSLGLAIVNVAVLSFVFKFRTQDACLTEIGLASQLEEGSNEGSRSKYKQMMHLRGFHLMALFILVYVGTEVTLGGWIVTYVVDLRGGGPSSGYISSGFFGGLMVGRIALLWINKLVGEKRVIYLYGVLAIGLEVVVWFVPSLVGDALAVSFVGMLLGPMYPLVMNHARHVLPPWLLNGCIGWIAGFGQAGSALLPLLTGLLASKVGIKVLQPLVVSMMGLMVGVWALVPNTPRRHE